MTTVRIKGVRGVRVIDGAPAAAPQRGGVIETTLDAIAPKARPPKSGPTKRPQRKAQRQGEARIPNMQGTQGPRIKEVKEVANLRDEKAAVARLVQLGHEHGAEYLRTEIATHERKLALLRNALQQLEPHAHE